MILGKQKEIYANSNEPHPTKTLATVLAASLVLPAMAASKHKLDSRIRDLTDYFESVQKDADNKVPAEVLQKAEGLIIVVDDDPSIAKALVSLMESLGYAAAGFTSAEEFLNSARVGQTACLILDVRMPGMGGLELQQRLAAQGDHTPIIFITAHGGHEISAEALRRGAVAFLRKPFSQESLLEAMRSALGRRAGPSVKDGRP